MTPPDVSDAAVEAACDARLRALMHTTNPTTEREAMRAAIAAAVPHLLEKVAVVCLNGSRYGHGLFADIEVQYDSPQSMPPKIGTTLYRLRTQENADG